MEIRPWCAGDEVLASAAEPYLITSLSDRLPAAYLRHLTAGPRPKWHAQVAVGDGHLIGWAEFGRVNATAADADVPVIVADPWYRRGAATALIRALLPRCVAAGVARLGADLLPTNRAAYGLLVSLFGPHLSGVYSDGVVRRDPPLARAIAEKSRPRRP